MWTILISGEWKLETLHISCQRGILRICWFHHITNAEVTSQTGQEDLVSRIRRRHTAVFGNVCQLPEEAPGQTVGTTVFRGTPNFKPSHEICPFPLNVYIFAKFCGIQYWPVIRAQICHILVGFRWP